MIAKYSCNSWNSCSITPDFRLACVHFHPSQWPLLYPKMNTLPSIVNTLKLKTPSKKKRRSTICHGICKKHLLLSIIVSKTGGGNDIWYFSTKDDAEMQKKHKFASKNATMGGRWACQLANIGGLHQCVWYVETSPRGIQHEGCWRQIASKAAADRATHDGYPFILCSAYFVSDE